MISVCLCCSLVCSSRLFTIFFFFFFFSSRRRHTRSDRDWSSDVCSSDLRRRQPARPHARDGSAFHPRLRRDGGPRLALPDREPLGPLSLSRGLSGDEIGRASCRERV